MDCTLYNLLFGIFMFNNVYSKKLKLYFLLPIHAGFTENQ